jgi:oligoribonuclease NrnB/cAMP/cGMP phosphodiesterase (DHH superfamily)
MIVYHHNDMDGRCAGAIVEMAFRDFAARIRFREVDYNSVIAVDEIERNEKVYIVDFSFKPDVMKQVLERTGNVFWIDHHSTAQAYDYGRVLPGHRDFAEPSKRSGAGLAWEFLFHTQPMPRVVQLVSDYDTWTMALKDSMPFMEGLKMKAHGPQDEIWAKLIADEKLLQAIIDQGKTAIEYRDNYCAEMRKAFGYECYLAGYKCYALNCYRFGGTMFGPLLDKYDMCIAYVENGQKTTVSVYSTKKRIHAGEICRDFGGGGHKGAAGFVVPKGNVLPWTTW